MAVGVYFIKQVWVLMTTGIICIYMYLWNIEKLISISPRHNSVFANGHFFMCTQLFLVFTFLYFPGTAASIGDDRG
jgi:hypothetical protein